MWSKTWAEALVRSRIHATVGDKPIHHLRKCSATEGAIADAGQMPEQAGSQSARGPGVWKLRLWGGGAFQPFQGFMSTSELRTAGCLRQQVGSHRSGSSVKEETNCVGVEGQQTRGGKIWELLKAQ